MRRPLLPVAPREKDFHNRTSSLTTQATRRSRYMVAHHIRLRRPASGLASPGGLMARLNEILNDNRTDKAGSTGHKNTHYALSFALSRSPTLFCYATLSDRVATVRP